MLSISRAFVRRIPVVLSVPTFSGLVPIKCSLHTTPPVFSVPSVSSHAPSTASTPSLNGAAFVSAVTAAATHRTENNAWTHDTTQDARVDLFAHLLPTTERDDALRLFEASWAQSPLDTLKLIFHAGSVRHGKSDKISFLHGLYWLSQKHPETLLANLQHVPSTTYWKDLLELLRRLNVGEAEYKIGFDRRKRTSLRQKLKKQKAKQARRKAFADLLAALPSEEARVQARQEKAQKIAEEEKSLMAAAREKRKALQKERTKHTEEKRNTDPIYAKVEAKVVDLFAKQLKEDTAQLKSDAKKKEISLAGKWAPSFKACFDKFTGISVKILRKLEDNPKIEVSETNSERAKTYQLLQRYLTPLRSYIEIPEKYMSSNQWNELPYNRVPSVAMKRYKKIFFEHDQERFRQFIMDKLKNTKTIASGALLPHQLVCEARTIQDETLYNVVELQWRSYVQAIKEKGTLSNIMPICDVSGSMNSLVDRFTRTIDVSVALSLLISEVAAPPFTDLICTFSEHPRFHTVKEVSLRDKIFKLQAADWGYNTNYQAVFDLILRQAKLHNLTNEQMIKRIVVLSDMEFDASATAQQYETDHMEAERKFKTAGYDLPQIIYWNLASRNRSTPVTVNSQGVCLVSGFSGNLLKLFMDGDQLEETPAGEAPVPPFANITPISIMEKAISAKEYERLQVVD